MRLYLFLFFLYLFPGIYAQVTIVPDITSGCNPVQVNFTIQPVSARDTITSIDWDFGNGKTESSNLSPVVQYDSIGSYTVSCLINGLYLISEPDLIHISCLRAPNVFSPNDDNINDFFIVETDGVSPYLFSVFTRSGSLVYKTESPTIIWDGRSLSGQKMKTGIYFFTIRQLNTDALNETKGIVYLFE
ncbi:MAG: gliding motility-associated C-terminal domain-containing protein [Bacteroidales bacterium]|nr:gliding motility-associated C-terminal domain-containing protein [Bacteroidales bacterium]